MGYIIALAILLIVVPILFMMLSRRTTGRGGVDSRDHGMTVEGPSSDEPTPRGDITVNPSTPAVDRRLPPG